ncbi:hypothetical protein JTE90_022055 [Oedothorax gibbosus]|uniref:Uncharacterized protein n=1 Tax=Oedothorax gibbosus TaxID=931172 RepID=A0AAV6V1Q6_9ARAC|nr:hypothetical protein JTE90_022055 [Oedothorax gibbosus]
MSRNSLNNGHRGQQNCMKLLFAANTDSTHDKPQSVKSLVLGNVGYFTQNDRPECHKSIMGFHSGSLSGGSFTWMSKSFTSWDLRGQIPMRVEE